MRAAPGAGAATQAVPNLGPDPTSSAADDAAQAARIRAKVRRRLVAPLVFLLFLAALDRANVGFAALSMNRDLRLSPSDYGLSASVFFIGFICAQYPSVLLFQRLGVKRWLALVLTAWGLAAAAMAFVQGFGQLLVLRALLGVAEAGLTPGIVLYLARWSPRRDRAATFALPMLAIPISLVLGQPLSGWLLEVGGGLPVASWRWLFLVEGAPVLLLAAAAYAYFPARYADAPWLAKDEALWLSHHSAAGHVAEGGPMAIPRDRRILAAGAMWFLLLCGAYAITFWLPQALKQMSGFGVGEIGLISALPWVGNGLGVVLNAYHSDRTQERFWHVTAAIVVAAGGFALLGGMAPSAAGIAVLVVAATALGAAQGVFWALTTGFVNGPGMAAGVALINTAGCASGIAIPWLVGALRQSSGGFSSPIYLVAGLTALSAVFAFLIKGGETAVHNPARTAAGD